MKRALSTSLLRLLRCALLLVCAGPSAALAQPMAGAMPDPRQMSGIPRPDPSLPPGRVTVRLLRADFKHPMAGQPVTLEGPEGTETAIAAANGRATFNGVKAGASYVARAKAGDEELASQPIEMTDSAGVAVMLVFKVDEQALLTATDAIAHLDRRLPAGTLVVSVVDGEDKPIAGMEVGVAHAVKDKPDTIDDRKAVTDERGAATFSGLPTGAGDGYIAGVRREGYSGSSDPFRFDAAGGMHLGLRALKVARDAKALVIAGRSHVLVEIKDEEVQVMENLFLENHGSDPFDSGPGGLVFKLPDGAQGAQLLENNQPQLSLEGNTLTFRGVLPPGTTPIQVGFFLPRSDDTVTLRQTLPVALERLTAIADRFDDMEVQGVGLDKEPHEMQGRRFWVIHGPGGAAGGQLELRLTGLPTRPTVGRNLAVVLAAVLFLWGLWGTVKPRRGQASRIALEERRAAVLDELHALEATASSHSDGGQGQGRRRELITELANVDQQLESLGQAAAAAAQS